MKRFLSLVLALAMVLSVMQVLAVSSYAEDVADPNARYISMAGAGKKDGSNWENAFEGNVEGGFEKAWDATPANGTLYVMGGDYIYPANLNSGGQSAEIRKKFIGVDDANGKRVTFIGDWEEEKQQKREGIVVANGVSNLYFENFDFNSFYQAFKIKGNSNDIDIKNVNSDECNITFYILGGASDKDLLSHNERINISDGKYYNYNKSVMRVSYGNRDCQFTNLYADAGGKDKWVTGNFPIAYHISHDKKQPKEVWDENITFTDCVGVNNYHQSTPDGYWNADTFCSETQARNVTYIRCYASGNTDGGWDVKMANGTLIDCVAVNNKRNFRFWCKNGIDLVNCLGAWSVSHGGLGSSEGIMVCGNGGIANATNCTFYNNSTTQISLEGGTINLKNCIVATDDPNGKLTNFNTKEVNELNMDDSNVLYIKGVMGEDPEFVNPYNRYYPVMDASFNSKYGASKGFYLKDAPMPTEIAERFEFKSDYWLDLEPYSWAKYSIERMTCWGFMDGRSNTIYAPADNITRGEFVSGVANALGLSGTSEAFADVDASHKYYKSITAAKAAGIALGDDNKFRPDEAITREDIMVIAARALKLSGKCLETVADPSLLEAFTDKAEISEYAKNDIIFLLSSKVITGYDDGTIKPKNNCNRAEGTHIVCSIYTAK